MARGDGGTDCKSPLCAWEGIQGTTVSDLINLAPLASQVLCILQVSPNCWAVLTSVSFHHASSDDLSLSPHSGHRFWAYCIISLALVAFFRHAIPQWTGTHTMHSQNAVLMHAECTVHAFACTCFCMYWIYWLHRWYSNAIQQNTGTRAEDTEPMKCAEHDVYTFLHNDYTENNLIRPEYTTCTSMHHEHTQYWIFWIC